MWRCVCECGNSAITTGNALKSGNTKSCGCNANLSSGERIKNLTGLRFGKLTVRERNGSLGKLAAWLCVCDCGKIVEQVRGRALTTGNTKSCGCTLNPDLTGLVFNRLTVIKRDEVHRGKKPKWVCRCDCGNFTSVISSHITSGDTKSCGCFKREITRERSIKYASDCSVFGCEDNHHSMGLCRRHYQMINRADDKELNIGLAFKPGREQYA